MNTLTRQALVVVAALAIGLAAAPSSFAAFVDIGSSRGPLTHIYIGDDLACQAFHTGDGRGEFFGSQVGPASCGTSVAVPDQAPATSSTVYGFRDTPMTPVRQSPVAGSGTLADPRRVTTIATAGSTGVLVSQRDSYAVGYESYRTDVTLTSQTDQNLVLFHAGDCYLQNTDSGYGFYDAPTGSIFCTQNANNKPAARLLGFQPLTRGSSYEENNYSQVFSAVSRGRPLPDTCDCGILEDNGAGISWSVPLKAGVPARYSFQTLFSPAGSTIGGPPPPVSGRSVDVAPVSGTVSIKLAGQRTFTRLTAGEQIPVGATVDTTHGRVRLVSAPSVKGGQQAAEFYDGAFVVAQKRGQSLTMLKLTGGNFRSCGLHAGDHGGPLARLAARRPRRSVWGSGHGSFGTTGNSASATVRGTIWLTEDDCEGTLIRVKRGVVTVRDLVRHKTIIVHAAQSYFAARKR